MQLIWFSGLFTLQLIPLQHTMNFKAKMKRRGEEAGLILCSLTAERELFTRTHALCFAVYVLVSPMVHCTCEPSTLCHHCFAVYFFYSSLSAKLSNLLKCLKYTVQAKSLAHFLMHFFMFTNFYSEDAYKRQ